MLRDESVSVVTVGAAPAQTGDPTHAHLHHWPFIETAIAASIFYMAIEGNPPNVAVRSGLAAGGSGPPPNDQAKKAGQ